MAHCFLKYWKNILCINWASTQETCLWWFANKTGADQPAQFDQCLCYSLIGNYHIKTCYKLNFTKSLQLSRLLWISPRRQVFSRGAPIDIWASAWQNLTLLHWNNRDTDQPVYPLSLICAYVNHSLESTVKPVLSGHSKRRPYDQMTILDNSD